MQPTPAPPPVTAADLLARKLGDVFVSTGFHLSRDPDTVLAPAVAFVQGAHSGPLGDDFHPGAPQLVVEMDCPSEEPDHLTRKVTAWLEAGCRMVVVVNPRRGTATVYRSPSDVVLLTADDAIDGSDVVPGWTLPLRQLFG